ncbi:c-type cytochrome [Roseicitreum antarcticum]|uniref:Cytochrome C oxidase, cbb3-type, subunit III n=1 Tax=Roseicitreum antarcticum TaxID=564137 RepID=A0A1H2SF10_9RHOB|nr:c-type cytochrome [Roseicitreum antarcticum]SDW30180.1 Cytochrome C oxidase, cbb3-type, subunit III [Roseicitreum antarcticum]
MLRKTLILAVIAATGLAGCVPAPSQSGRAVFDASCAGCHGTDARGGVGPDLTLLSTRNGGSFPMTAVLDQIDGYAQGQPGRARTMPPMGDLMTGPLVRVDTGAGVTRPVPEKIVALSAYLRGVQR